MRIPFLLILLSILISNTFSPQYLIWLAPFVAFLDDEEIGLFISASFLTWVYFRHWSDLIQLQPVVIWVLIIRNLLLILLFLVSIYKIWAKSRRKELNGRHKSS